MFFTTISSSNLEQPYEMSKYRWPIIGTKESKKLKEVVVPVSNLFFGYFSSILKYTYRVKEPYFCKVNYKWWYFFCNTITDPLRQNWNKSGQEQSSS